MRSSCSLPMLVPTSSIVHLVPMKLTMFLTLFVSRIAQPSSFANWLMRESKFPRSRRLSDPTHLILPRSWRFNGPKGNVTSVMILIISPVHVQNESMIIEDPNDLHPFVLVILTLVQESHRSSQVRRILLSM